MMGKMMSEQQVGCASKSSQVVQDNRSSSNEIITRTTRLCNKTIAQEVNQVTSQTANILIISLVVAVFSCSTVVDCAVSSSSSRHFDYRHQASAFHQQNNHSAPPVGWSPRVGSIRLIRLDTPNRTVEGQPIKLRCLHENRGDRLQSLSWSRNGREFYRYQPFERNPQHQHLFFNSTGIHPDIHKSRNNTVLLTNTTVDTSGRYRCEVTGSQFQEVKMETYINVTSASNGVNGRTHNSNLMLMIIQWVVLAAGFVQMKRLINNTC